MKCKRTFADCTSVGVGAVDEVRSALQLESLASSPKGYGGMVRQCWIDGLKLLQRQDLEGIITLLYALVNQMGTACSIVQEGGQILRSNAYAQ